MQNEKGRQRRSTGSAGHSEYAGSDDPAEHDEYTLARQLTLELGAASPAWLARQLGISLDVAVSYIERMQHEGLVSPLDHVGRRIVLSSA